MLAALNVCTAVVAQPGMVVTPARRGDMHDGPITCTVSLYLFPILLR